MPAEGVDGPSHLDLSPPAPNKPCALQVYAGGKGKQRMRVGGKGNQTAQPQVRQGTPAWRETDC